MKITRSDIINAGYKIKKDGTIIGKWKRPLKPGLDTFNRPIVVLMIEGQRHTLKVSRLVALMHLDEDLHDDKVVICQDRDNTNCHIDNLLITNRSIQTIKGKITDNTHSRGVKIHPAYKDRCCREQKWVAKISNQYIGIYVSKQGAIAAYNNKAKQLYGDHAPQNKPNSNRGRPKGWVMPQSSKDKISKSKKGRPQKQRTKDKISIGLQRYFNARNPISEELANRYCHAMDDDLCNWLHNISEELDASDDILVESKLRNKGKVEITCGHNIEYFSHEITPELLYLIKEFAQENGWTLEEAMERTEGLF